MNLKDLEYKYGLSKGAITFIVAFCSFILWSIDSFFLLLPRGKRSRNQRVLVVKLDAIGDFILWLDFARGLREYYASPETEIVLVANKACEELARQSLHFDEVIAVDRMKFLLYPPYRVRVLAEVRRKRVDVAIDPVFSREFNLSPAIIRTCGAKTKIGSSGDASNQREWQKTLSDRWYSELFPASPRPEMELIRNAQFLRQLGHKKFKAQLPLYRPNAAPDDDFYYILFPGAGWVKRQWPVERFAALASEIHDRYGLKGIICGGPAEKLLADAIGRLTDTPLDDMTGRTTLPELASLIAGAQILIGNETSAIHLAAAVSTPAVCILGGGHFGRFVPYQVEQESDRPVPFPVYHEMDCYHCNWICIHPTTGDEPVPCIAQITVKAVWQNVRRVLEASCGS